MMNRLGSFIVPTKALFFNDVKKTFPFPYGVNELTSLRLFSTLEKEIEGTIGYLSILINHQPIATHLPVFADGRITEIPLQEKIGKGSEITLIYNDRKEVEKRNAQAIDYPIIVEYRYV